jgi:probable phosphoglycerate mutase
VASVFSSDSSRAVQTAEIVAVRLGVAATACKSLRAQWYAGSLDARFEGGESGTEVVARHREQLEEIADLHRGETVLVVGHQTALGIVVPTLAQNLTTAWAQDNEPANTESVELENDADGWMVRRWGTRRL